MTNQSVAPRRTTRHHRCDEQFLDLLEEDFGIPRVALSCAFLGFPACPKRRAIALCEWASRKDEPGKALMRWARKREQGAFRPGSGE